MKENNDNNERIERTAEVTFSAPKADAKPSGENIHDKGRKAVDRLEADLIRAALQEGKYRIVVKKNGATVSGADVEITYLELVLDVDVEVKQGDTGTSQVRSYEYFPVAVWGKNTECWYVFSPDEIVKRARNCAPQHALNRFICCNIGSPGSTPTKGDKQLWSKAKCKPEDLPKALLDAYLKGEEYPKVKRVVKNIEKREKLNEEEDMKEIDRAFALDESH